MKIALIPSIPDRAMSRLGDGLHLLLAHLCDDPNYVEYYKARSRAGDYVILDNSAHEHGTGSPMEDLLHLARRLEANEVVIPDVLFDLRGTLESAHKTLRWLATDGWHLYATCNRPRLMLVPQGQTQEELRTCLRGLLQAWGRFVGTAPGIVPPPVIGVSKDYEDIGNGLLPFVAGPLFQYRGNGMYDVHILGWPSNLWATAAIARACPWVRSTDSAKPFVYAEAGIALEPGGPIPKYPRRSLTYFQSTVMGADNYDLARRNIEVFRAAATDELVA